MTPLRLSPKPILLFAYLSLLVACQKEPDRECSITCIGDGLAISAEVCSDEVMRYKRCRSPDLVREPVAGELVSVISNGEIRTTIVLSVGDSGDFTVGGPPAVAELGSAVEAITDGALLGLVQSFSDAVSTCTTP